MLTKLFLARLHATDYGVEGLVPEELCAFSKLTEYDLDGGHLEGPIPTFFASCFPRLREIDLSYNRVRCGRNDRGMTWV